MEIEFEKIETSSAVPATVDHHAHDHKNVQSGKPHYVIVLAAFTSLGGWFFGYDQGVTGGIVVMNSFKNDFCIGVFANESTCNLQVSALPTAYRRYVILFTVCYNAGCFIGAVFICSYVAEKYGRRAIIFLSSVLFLVGTGMVILPPGGSRTIMVFILIGRIVEGTGVGCSSFACPLYASEIAPTNLRGMLSAFTQMTIVMGLFAANVVNNLIQDHKWGWRISNAVILIAPVTIMIGTFLCPETPRWLYKTKGREFAEISLKRIRQLDDVSTELDAISDALQEEGNQVSIKELFTRKKMFQRLCIGICVHIFNQATGINPIFTFGGMIYESVLGKGILSLLVLSGVAMLSTIPGLFLIDRIGRRNLAMYFGLGMFAGHVLSATVFVTSCSIVKTLANDSTSSAEFIHCKSHYGVLMLIFTVIFVSFYGLSWGVFLWVYTSEIFPLNVRARGVSLATATHWFMGVVVSYILELISPLGIGGVFYLFSGLCLMAVLFIYLFCPETKGVLLEDIEQQFDNFRLKDRALVKILMKPFKLM